MTNLIQINQEHDSEETKRKKTLWMLIVVAAVIVVGITLLVVFSYYFNNRCFDSYEVQNTVDRSDSNNVNYYFYKNNLLKCSRSGINAIDNTGKSLWNGGFEMEQPQVDTCGDYVMVADVTGKTFFVYHNGKDEGTSIETTLPIVRAKVASQGVVAALLQDKDSNVLNIYNPYSTADNLLVEIPTNVKEEGYPLDFDVSPDGNSVVTSHMVVSGNKIENKVSFYNFTEVGQDKNTLVGGKSFDDRMISNVSFVGDDEVAVFHEKGFSLFTGMKQPELLSEQNFKEEIKSVAYSDSYIAVVTGTAGSTEKQKLHLYNLKGKEELTQDISFDYVDMNIYKEEIIFSSNHTCNILRTNGHEKFNYQFEREVEGIFPTENGNVYTLIDTSTIQKIKLGG